MLYLVLGLCFLLPLAISLLSRYSLRSKINTVQIAERYLFVREVKANRSPEIDSMNRNAGAPVGSYWCASFVKWILDKAVINYQPQRINALARSLVNKQSFTAFNILNGKAKILCGDVLIWQKGKTSSGHTGFADDNWDGTAGTTIEGNTAAGGAGNQANGDRVAIKNRRIEPFNYFRIKWITRFKLSPINIAG